MGFCVLTEYIVHLWRAVGSLDDEKRDGRRVRVCDREREGRGPDLAGVMQISCSRATGRPSRPSTQGSNQLSLGNRVCLDE